MDTNLQNVCAGRTTLGDEDADVEITSVGTTLLADLDLILNPNGSGAQLGVNVTRCPAGTTGDAHQKGRPALHPPAADHVRCCRNMDNPC